MRSFQYLADLIAAIIQRGFLSGQKEEELVLYMATRTSMLVRLNGHKILAVLMLFLQYANGFRVQLPSAGKFQSLSLGSSDPKVDLTMPSDCCDGVDLHGPTSSFIKKGGPVTEEDLSDTNLVKIVQLETTDIDTNVLLWKCLGYTYDAESNAWTNANVFPKWKAKFPEPPDMIGVTRKYDPDTDKVVRNASMDLMRSIPRTFKGGIRNLQHVGFKGFKLNELTPNKTRRAQSVNWMLYYRETLFGKTFEELVAQREKEIKPSAEVAELPSEKHFQRLRLDGEEDTKH